MPKNRRHPADFFQKWLSKALWAALWPLLVCVQPVAAQDSGALRLERIERPGPVQGVLARVRLGPAVQVGVFAAGGVRSNDTATATHSIQLNTVAAALERHQLDLALNASFFAVPQKVRVQGKELAYAVGNWAEPVGWHLAAGQLRATPRSPQLRATWLVHTDGRHSIQANLLQLPADAHEAMSGNALLLQAGELRIEQTQGARAPRSAVGLSADGTELLLLALDGRSSASLGATLHELAELMRSLGAADAINLDGGGSTSMAARDPLTGAVHTLNQPSDPSALGAGLRTSRPVADVIGVRLLK